MGRNTIKQGEGTLIVNEEVYRPLVYYLRKKPKNGNKRGAPYGVVVALDKEHIGWSLQNWLDPWNRKQAVSMAAGRATRGYGYWMEQFSQWVTESGFPIGEVLQSGLPKLTAVVEAMKIVREMAIEKEDRDAAAGRSGEVNRL